MLALVAAVVLAQTTPPPPQADAQAIFTRWHEAVYTVETDTTIGTAFQMSPAGLITCEHVIGSKPTKITLIASDGKRYAAKLLLADAVRDLALVGTDSALPSTPAVLAKFPYLADAPQGYEAVVIGSPLGLPQTVAKGVVSAKRTIKGVQMLQIAIPVSHGSSGSPVFRGDGLVIGVVDESIESGQQLNFAVFAEEVFEMYFDWKKHLSNSGGN